MIFFLIFFFSRTPKPTESGSGSTTLIKVAVACVPVMVPDVSALVEPFGALVALESILVHLVRLHHVGLHLLHRHFLRKKIHTTVSRAPSKGSVVQFRTGTDLSSLPPPALPLLASKNANVYRQMGLLHSHTRT
jgi:hypothetical protein